MWLLFMACTGSASMDPPPAPPPPTPTPTWPQAGAPLQVRTAPTPGLRLLLDPGHGTKNNEGNTGVHCEKEQSVMLRIAEKLQPELQARALDVALSRTDHDVPYDDRIRAANQRDVMISLHSDSRAGTGWAQAPSGCWQSFGAAGIAVLWSDEGVPALVASRHRLAQTLAIHLAAVGFQMYSGVDYLGLYEADSVPGVFVDRHEPNQRIRVLRRPTVASVLIETHDAHDINEVARWEEPLTHAAFAGALATGLAAWQAGP